MKNQKILMSATFHYKKRMDKNLSRWSTLAVSVILLLPSLAGATMIEGRPRPSLSPLPGKALLVCSRTTFYGWKETYHIFLDRKMWGVSKRHYYITINVDPGPHYIMAVSGKEKISTAKLMAETGRTYFLSGIIVIGWHRARGSLVVQDSLGEALKDVSECAYVEYESGEEKEILGEEDYRNAVSEFEHCRESDPSNYNEYVGYRGGSIMSFWIGLRTVFPTSGRTFVAST